MLKTRYKTQDCKMLYLYHIWVWGMDSLPEYICPKGNRWTSLFLAQNWVLCQKNSEENTRLSQKSYKYFKISLNAVSVWKTTTCKYPPKCSDICEKPSNVLRSNRPLVNHFEVVTGYNWNWSFNLRISRFTELLKERTL